MGWRGWDIQHRRVRVRLVSRAGSSFVWHPDGWAETIARRVDDPAFESTPRPSNRHSTLIFGASTCSAGRASCSSVVGSYASAPTSTFRINLAT